MRRRLARGAQRRSKGGKVGLQRSLTEIRAEIEVVEEGKGRLDNSREDAEERMRMRGGVD